MTFLEQVLAILWKDIRCELRSKQTWTSMGLFALLVLVIFNFAFDLRVDNKAAIAPGALWVAFVFASLLGLGRTIAVEREKGLMDRLLALPGGPQGHLPGETAGQLALYRRRGTGRAAYLRGAVQRAVVR